jgi:hypothetical protein
MIRFASIEIDPYVAGVLGIGLFEGLLDELVVLLGILDFEIKCDPGLMIYVSIARSSLLVVVFSLGCWHWLRLLLGLA